jgi:hypothetical protein
VLIHQQIRFHGKVSGLHLLGRSVRTDDRHEGGIWSVIFTLYTIAVPHIYISGNYQWQECGPSPGPVTIHLHGILPYRYLLYTFKIFFWIFTLPMCIQRFPSSTKVVFWPNTIPGAVFSKCAFVLLIQHLMQLPGCISKCQSKVRFKHP